MTDRAVAWEGFYNARDLGGLPTVGGDATARGEVFRSALLTYVTPAGWACARDAGVASVIDLREPVEVSNDGGPPPLPDGIAWRNVPLDDFSSDRTFWAPFMDDGRYSTPLYYPAFLRAKSSNVAAAFTALAAAPGGVVVHCAAGRDRTGLIAALLLRLAGVEPGALSVDYALSTPALVPLWLRAGRQDPTEAIARTLRAFGTTGPKALLDAVGELDVRSYLLDAGVLVEDVDSLAARLKPDTHAGGPRE